jgi:hypothetical protein
VTEKCKGGYEEREYSRAPFGPEGDDDRSNTVDGTTQTRDNPAPWQTLTA